MTAMAMQMPSMPPPPPGPSTRPATGAAAPPFATQQPAGRAVAAAAAAAVPAASPGLGASSLSLALPVASQQAAAGGSTPRAAPFMGPGHNNATANAAGGVLSGQGPHQPAILASPSDIPSRVKLADMIPEDGVASPGYTRAVEMLSQSLAKNNAAIIELSGEDAAFMRCALESSRLYFRSRPQGVEASHPWHASDQGKSSGYLTTAAQSFYCYRAGRSSAGEGSDPPPPCMPEAFRCLGKASRACLSAIARHLQLRSDAFCPLLDDSPLVPGEVSHSVLTAAAHFTSSLGKTHVGGEAFHGQDVEKGLLRLIASDSAGLQVCDSSGRWYLADSGLGPGDLLLLVGRALHQATAGLRKSSAFRVVPVPSSNPSTSGPVGRISMTFRMVPRDSAMIDCTSLAEAGHPVSETFSPVLVSQFMEGLKAAEALMGNGADKALEPARGNSEPSLRNVLSDPLTGALLEDAKVAPCGHSFGGATLQRVYESRVCISCGAGVDVNSLVPNYALQAAARAFRREERNRHAQVTTGLRGVKRKKEIADISEPKAKRVNKSNLSILPAPEPSNSSPEATPRPPKGVQYPFAVNERVMIKGNKRTAGKYVGREAVVTNKCLNGWYLVTMVDNSESLRLQYRSLAKATTELKNGVSEDRQAHSADL